MSASYFNIYNISNKKQNHFDCRANLRQQQTSSDGEAASLSGTPFEAWFAVISKMESALPPQSPISIMFTRLFYKDSGHQPRWLRLPCINNMRQLVWCGSEGVKLKHSNRAGVPPSQDEVLVKIRAVGICGTDIHILKGTFAGAQLAHDPWA